MRPPRITSKTSIIYKVLAKTPIDGLLTIKIGATEHILGPEVARNIFVAPVEAEAR